MSTPQNGQPKSEKLWIGQEWYIPVDQHGYCESESAEGALGFVIKLHSGMSETAHRALKIPRLLGDTHRENAYVCQLMDQEIAATQKVANELGKFGVGKLLLPLGIGGGKGSPLRGMVVTDPSVQDADKWNGSVVLVRFEKDRKPQFCLVKKKDEENLEFHPPGIGTSSDIPQLTMIEFDLIRRATRSEDIRFYAAPSPGEENKPFTMKEAVTREATGATWYAGLPSVVYPWAPDTLQEAISRVNNTGVQPRGYWNIDQHLELAENICSSLLALHGHYLLHCDLRPANILIRGHASNPGDYYVADYGSFAADQLPGDDARTNVGIQASGGAQGASQLDSGAATKLPVVVGERASAFYAPERRVGREREAADTAVFVKRGNAYLAILGWKTDFFNPNDEIDLQKIDGYIDSAQPADPDKSYPDSVLLRGDRIQIREFIFELDETEKRYEDKQILQVRPEYWQIYHGKIAVRVERPLDLGKDLPVPRTVELMKWTVATDLYGLGTLLLYSLFRNQIETHQDGSKLEDEFREMLTQLNNRQYFDAIWLELDWLRYIMEETLDKSWPPEDIAQEANTNDDENDNNDKSRDFAHTPFRSYLSRDLRRDDPRTLFDAAVAFTNRVTQTAPGVRRIVTALDHNVAVFVFVLHFSLCCIHREVHLDIATRGPNKGWDDKWLQLFPFCENRHEMPDPKFAAQQALKRLSTLRKNLGKSEVSSMKAEVKAIRGYDPRPDYSVRVALDQLINVIGQIQSAVDKSRVPNSLNPTKKKIEEILNDIPKAILEPQQTDNGDTEHSGSDSSATIV